MNYIHLINTMGLYGGLHGINKITIVIRIISYNRIFQPTNIQLYNKDTLCESNSGNIPINGDKC